MAMTAPRGSVRRLLSPLVRFAEHLVAAPSPWDRVTIPVPESVFGPGSQHPFAEYFDGESSVRVGSIDDILAWLQTCHYVSDLELFHERDVWQHPRAFEQIRRGDCEDFALWAWRKLAELGVYAEFYVGRVAGGGGPGENQQHAWVVYRVDGESFLFEPAARVPWPAIRPLDEAMADYIPHFSVDHQFVTSAFAGCACDAVACPR